MSPPSLLLALTVLASALALSDALAQRDAWLWPYEQTSIWNMPIGSEAEYVEAGIEPVPFIGTDVVHLLRTEESDPLRQAYGGAPFDGKRCSGQEQFDLTFHLPDDFIVRDNGNSPYGSTPNSTFAFLLPDGETVFGAQQMARCEEGGPIYVAAYLRWPNNVENAKASIYGDGLDGGGHGATGMSSLGGLLRVGDLTSDEPIRHAVKLMIWAEKHLYYDQSEETPGYRWPAKRADNYAEGEYGGTNPALQMGSLLAIPPEVSEADLGLESKPGRKLFRALQDYGAYITEDPRWNSHAVTISEAAYLEFEDVYGYGIESEAEATPWARDVNRLVQALYVVDNNGPESIGGGGTPRQPLAPPLSRTGLPTSTDRPEAPAELPDGFALEAAYPNPFNPQTAIRYALPERADVRLEVFDAMGRRVALLVEEPQAAGHHEATFEAASLPSGLYLYRLTTTGTSETFVRTGKAMLVK